VVSLRAGSDLNILQPLEPELGNASEGKRHGREIFPRCVLGNLYEAAFLLLKESGFFGGALS
jgi:hypothetical protein